MMGSSTSRRGWAAPDIRIGPTRRPVDGHLSARLLRAKPESLSAGQAGWRGGVGDDRWVGLTSAAVVVIIVFVLSMLMIVVIILVVYFVFLLLFLFFLLVIITIPHYYVRVFVLTESQVFSAGRVGPDPLAANRQPDAGAN
jgi:Flp pilus assembly protein TadB